MVNQYIRWQALLLVVPVVYVIFRSYRLYLSRLETEKNHAEAMATLHLRTIEALALAIDAKDHTTHDHLERVQAYAVEIGKELGLSGLEMQALQAAALLHDIGKLAVPEHIISKPGKLTPEEFEKMKIHPVVGAEILERVKFPYPVVPIVRHHHERWDGTGYPAGLKGLEIPIGARILAAVDCLDALASDRQYRRALPIDKALAVVVSESGKSYDPAVVEVLRKKCLILGGMKLSDVAVTDLGSLSLDVKIENGKAPATGFEQGQSTEASAPKQADFLQTIGAARQEAQALFELAQALGNSLSLNDTLSVMAARVRNLVPFDAIAVYLVRNGKLKAEYAIGEDSRLFASLEIPVGQGLSGWVAENRKAIVNGNPSVEPGYLNDPKVFSRLHSALAVPLEDDDRVVGVLTLYHAEKDAFSRDQLRVLQALGSKLSISIENAMKYERAETSATVDYLTSLPNARSLFVHLEDELARCKREDTELMILLCDLDGFKQVNDRFGHLAGNKVLSLFASGMKERCRPHDYVARMGGDEFVVVLPGLTQAAVRKKAQELDQVAEDAGRQVCVDAILGLSVGEALYGPDGQDAQTLLGVADQRMYKDKQRRKEAKARGQSSTRVP